MSLVEKAKFIMNKCTIFRMPDKIFQITKILKILNLEIHFHLNKSFDLKKKNF